MTHNTTRIGLATLTTCAVAVLTAAPAWAHVHVEAEDIQPGAHTTLTFQVPNESEKGAATTELTVALPNLTSVRTQQMSGWAVRLDRDAAAGTVKSITWTAAPSAGIPPDQFALFRVAVMLPTTDSVSFPATQTYSDGTVVKWDQPTPPGGAEPEYPAPTLALTAAHSDEPSTSTSDATARWLAGGGIVIAAIAVILTLRRRRA